MLTRRSGLPDTSIVRVATTEVVSLPPTATVKSAVDTMVRYGFRRVPVTEPDDRTLVGVLTGRDVLEYLVGERREILDRRHEGRFLPGLHEPIRSLMRTEVYVVTPYDTVGKAVKTMMKFDVGALPVVEGDKLVGIVTERDLVFDMYDVVSDVPVSEAMTEDPITTDPGSKLLEAAETMVKRGFRRLPVVEGGRLTGILTMTDVLHHVSVKSSEVDPDATVEEALDVPVSRVMTEDVITISPDDTLEEAVLRMKGASVGGLVVEETGDVVGILTERDVLHAIAEAI